MNRIYTIIGYIAIIIAISSFVLFFLLGCSNMKNLIPNAIIVSNVAVSKLIISSLLF